MIRAAVCGYGNVGKDVIETILVSPDIELAGVVYPKLKGETVRGAPVVSDIDQLENIDVALLALPSRIVPDYAAEVLSKGICTVDSFDIHSEIFKLCEKLDQAAKGGGAAAVTAAGWDPGTDSVIRCLFEAMAPRGTSYTNFGPGMSMGHTVAVKAIEGVRDALSVTIPLGTGIHRRMVYMELEDGYDFQTVEAKIKTDDYFIRDETHVKLVDRVSDLKDMGHGVHLERKGVSGTKHNQLLTFDMRIDNPALTAQIMVSSARAATRQRPGCYTMIEIPPVDYLPGERESAIRRLV